MNMLSPREYRRVVELANSLEDAARSLDGGAAEEIIKEVGLLNSECQKQFLKVVFGILEMNIHSK